MTSNGNSVRVSQVALRSESINDGDVFILDNGLTIYQFNAPNASHTERLRAMEIIQQDIKPERDGMPDLVILDGEEVLECDPFWELLGGKVDALAPADADRAVTAQADIDFSAQKKLFRISDESGSLVLGLEKEDSHLSETDVNDVDVWAIACGGSCFIYIGEGSTKDEKFYVWNTCGSILLAAGLDETAPVTFFSKESDSSVWSQLFQ